MKRFELRKETALYKNKLFIIIIITNDPLTCRPTAIAPPLLYLEFPSSNKTMKQPSQIRNGLALSYANLAVCAEHLAQTTYRRTHILVHVRSNKSIFSTVLRTRKIYLILKEIQA